MKLFNVFVLAFTTLTLAFPVKKSAAVAATGSVSTIPARKGIKLTGADKTDTENEDSLYYLPYPISKRQESHGSFEDPVPVPVHENVNMMNQTEITRILRGIASNSDV
ncbi:hypothetical protein OY671_007500 [Metschnikowia pulcherrima]|nr:hypothetical protein OY671_007500 [Metschnikowia pulcherrima]